MPNPAMEKLNKDSTDTQIQAAISDEMSLCMSQPGAEQKACAGKAFGMAREATGKELNLGQ